jgi:hypothetical protein
MTDPSRWRTGELAGGTNGTSSIVASRGQDSGARMLPRDAPERPTPGAVRR